MTNKERREQALLLKALHEVYSHNAAATSWIDSREELPETFECVLTLQQKPGEDPVVAHTFIDPKGEWAVHKDFGPVTHWARVKLPEGVR